MFEHGPPILFIVLERGFQNMVGRHRKDGRCVSFPDVFERGAAGSYRLAGVVRHLGPSLHGGHYVCHVRTGSETSSSRQDTDSDFVCFDDGKVEAHSFAVLEQDVVQSQVYLLAYYRSSSSSRPRGHGAEPGSSGDARRRLQRTFSHHEGRPFSDPQWEQQARSLGPTPPPPLSSPPGSQAMMRQGGRSLRRTYYVREGWPHDVPYPSSHSGLVAPAGLPAAADPPRSHSQVPTEKMLLEFFTPRFVDPSKCQARLLREGVARQCGGRPVQGLGLCAQHRAKGRGKGARLHNSRYGVVTGSLPEAVIPELLEEWRRLQPSVSVLEQGPTLPVGSGDRAASAAPVSPRSVRVGSTAVHPGVALASASASHPGSYGEPDTAPAVRRRPLTRSRVVTGFGDERIDDVIGDEEQRWAEGARRGNVRRETGTRGRMRDLAGQDLDRSAGSAWHAGRR